MELSKAFYSVDHSILLKKQRILGFQMKSLTGLKATLQIESSSFALAPRYPKFYQSLTECLREQYCHLYCSASIYINDLSRVPQASELVSFVDDSKIFMSFPIEDIASAKTKIEEDLKLVATWFFENKLLINSEKTKLLMIGTRPLLGRLLEGTTIIFLGEEITPTTNAKDLRLTLDSYLTYDYHIKNVVSSCMAKLCQKKRVKYCFDSDSLLLIINALVMSKLY